MVSFDFKIDKIYYFYFLANSEMDKKERNRLLNELEEKELEEFRSNLPFNEKYFPKLFDFVDQKLNATNCKNNYTFTTAFCNKHNLDIEKLKTWLMNDDNCCACDCEVLNLVDAFQYLIPKKKIVISKSKNTSQRLSNLTTDFGFQIDIVETPWQLKEITKNKEVNYVFQLGKKEGHIASLLNVSDITKFYNDDFLKSDYSIQTELNYDLEFILLRENYKNFEYTTVKTKRWAPIFIYFKPVDSNNWVLRLYTESSRINGDLKEFYKILDHIK
ncbi:MAG: DUF2695 domain-containing protein [Flavobacteriaceae bacterium]|nr:DUF2695 domain-containing protein [Flavobacteriaceae bacterium]